MRGPKRLICWRQTGLSFQETFLPSSQGLGVLCSPQPFTKKSQCSCCLTKVPSPLPFNKAKLASIISESFTIASKLVCCVHKMCFPFQKRMEPSSHSQLLLLPFPFKMQPWVKIQKMLLLHLLKQATFQCGHSENTLHELHSCNFVICQLLKK